MEALRDIRAMNGLGERIWVIPDGYIPADNNGRDTRMAGQTVCIVNTGYDPASVEITIFFSDRDPLGPYEIHVPGRRKAYVRFEELDDPKSVPRDTDYASVLISDRPIIVQQIRLDSGEMENAPPRTVAVPVTAAP